MMEFRILKVQEAEDGVYVDFRLDTGIEGEYMVRKVGPFDGADPWEDIRLWLAMNGEEEERKRPPQGMPPDIAELVGKPVDTSELRQRYKPQLDHFKERAAQAQREAEEARQGNRPS